MPDFPDFPISPDDEIINIHLGFLFVACDLRLGVRRLCIGMRRTICGGWETDVAIYFTSAKMGQKLSHQEGYIGDLGPPGSKV